MTELMQRRRALIGAGSKRKWPLWIRPDVDETISAVGNEYKTPLYFSLDEWQRIEYSLIFFNTPFYATCISAGNDIDTSDDMPNEMSVRFHIQGKEQWVGKRYQPVRRKLDLVLNRGTLPAGGGAQLSAYYNKQNGRVANIGLCRFAVYTSANVMALEVIPAFDDAGTACLYDTVARRFLHPTENGKFVWGFDI